MRSKQQTNTAKAMGISTLLFLLHALLESGGLVEEGLPHRTSDELQEADLDEMKRSKEGVKRAMKGRRE